MFRRSATSTRARRFNSPGTCSTCSHHGLSSRSLPSEDPSFGVVAPLVAASKGGQLPSRHTWRMDSTDRSVGTGCLYHLSLCWAAR
jgi:hypothetical protein